MVRQFYVLPGTVAGTDVFIALTDWCTGPWNSIDTLANWKEVELVKL